MAKPPAFELLFKGLLILVFIVGIGHVQRHFIDYPVYEMAARKVIEGDISHLYDRERNVPGGYYYSYFFALAFVPFALLPALGGKIAFYFLFVLSYVKALEFSLRHAGAEKAKMGCLLIFLSLYAVNDAFMNANIGVVLLALGILAYEQAARRPALAGLCVGAAITFKIFPLLFLCYFIWAKQWKVVAWSVGFTALLLLGAPLLVYGPTRGGQLLSDQLYVLSHFGSHWPFDSLVFQNIPATAMRYWGLLGGNPQAAFRPALFIAGVAVLALFLPTFLQKRRVAEKTRDLFFYFSLSLVPLLTPVSWYNMALFYLPLLGWVTQAGFAGRRRGALAAVGVYFLLFCLTTPDIIGRPLNDRLELFAVPFWGVMAVVGYFVLVNLVRKAEAA